MIKAIKNSFVFACLQVVLDGINAFIATLHQRITKRPFHNQPIQSSLFNRWIIRLVQRVHNLQDRMHQAGHNSTMLQAGSWLRRFLNALQWLLLLLPFNYIFIDYLIRRIPALASVATIWDELALIGCLLYVAFRPLWCDGDYHFKWTGIDGLVVLFFGVGIALLNIVSPEMDIAIEGFRAVYQHMLWYGVARQLIRPSNRLVVIRGIVLLSSFLGCHALYQYIRRVPMPGNWVDSTETITVRAFSIIGSPNILAAIFVLVIPITAAYIYYESRSSLKWLAAAALPIAVLGLLFTFARQAYLALGGSVILFFIIFYPAIVKYLVVFGGIVLAALPSVANRIFYLFTPTYFTKSARGGRIIRYLYAIEKWQDAPLLGNGLGRFGGAVATHHDLTPFYVDSYYLKTLGEMGLVGLFSMLILFISVLIYTIAVIKRQTLIKHTVMLSGLFVGLLGISLQNAVENIFEVPMMIILFWGCVALVISFDDESHENSDS